MPLSYHLTLFSNDIVNFVIFNGSSCPIFWVQVCTENEKRGFIYVFTRRKKKFVSIEYRNRVPITKTDVAHNVVFFVFFLTSKPVVMFDSLFYKSNLRLPDLPTRR